MLCGSAESRYSPFVIVGFLSVQSSHIHRGTPWPGVARMRSRPNRDMLRAACRTALARPRERPHGSRADCTAAWALNLNPTSPIADVGDILTVQQITHGCYLPHGTHYTNNEFRCQLSSGYLQFSASCLQQCCGSRLRQSLFLWQPPQANGMAQLAATVLALCHNPNISNRDKPLSCADVHNHVSQQLSNAPLWSDGK